MKLIVLHRVWPEFLDSAEWYQMERDGLGGDFIDAVNATINALKKTPLAYPLIYRDARRALVSRFPFGIFFAVRGKVIYVFSISHLHRNPRNWRRALPAQKPPSKPR